MTFEEFPAPLALLFGGYIIGTGYLALISYLNDDEEFNKIQTFDKFMISLIFGFLGFTIMLSIFRININLEDGTSILNFLKAAPIFFIINVFLSKVLMELWESFHNFFIKRFTAD